MRQVSRSSSDLHRIVNQAQTLSGADADQFFRLGSSSSTTDSAKKIANRLSSRSVRTSGTKPSNNLDVPTKCKEIVTSWDHGFLLRLG